MPRHTTPTEAPTRHRWTLLFAAALGACSGEVEPAAPADCACPGAQVCSRSGACIAPGTCAVDADCTAGARCDPQTARCLLAGACGERSLATGRPAPNLFILLDRSCSMAHRVHGHSKWRTALDALGRMLDAHQGAIRFGLSLFPDRQPGKCGQGEIAVPLAADREDAIRALLLAARDEQDPNYPSGPCVTNIDAALAQASAAPFFAAPERESFLLLITDGMQYGCETAGGDRGTRRQIKALAARGIKTFVLGFGDKVDPQQLDSFATVGGVPAEGGERSYYRADDPQSFEQALAHIASRSKGHCHHALDPLPAALHELRVTFDGGEVARDPQRRDGWELDASRGQLSFYGAACAELEAQRVREVNVQLTCLQPGGGGAAGDCDAALRCSADAHCPAAHRCAQGCCVAPLR